MIFEQFRDAPFFKDAAETLNKRKSIIDLTGQTNASAAHFVCAYNTQFKQKVVILAQNELAVSKFSEDLITLGEYEPDRVLKLPPLEYMLYEVEARSSELESERVGTLYKLTSGEWDAVVLSLPAAMQPLPEPKHIKENAVILTPGMQLEPTELADRLARIGYVRTSQIDGRGQFAVRGDILDLFPGASAVPFRIEFFDTEIDTIRSFSLETQRTIENVDSVLVLPERETFIWDEAQAIKIRTDLKAELLTLNPSSPLAISLNSDIDKIRPYCRFPGYDKYLPYVLGKGYDIFDYCKNAVLFICDPNETVASGEQSLADYVSIAETVKNSTGLPERSASLLKPAEESLRNLIEKAYSVGQFWHFDTKSSNSSSGYMPPERKIEQFGTLIKTPDSMGDDPERLVNYIKEKADNGFSVILMAESTGRERLLRNLLEESELTGRCSIKTGNISESIEYTELKLSVVSSSKIFKRARAHVKRKLRGQAITAFAELKPGDLVVHDVHGIGRFEGVEAIQIDGQKKDYIKIIYRDNGVIYVPAIQLDSVQKYIGGDENEPQLSKLGSSEWKRATGKVKNSLRVYAKELVELYARRSQIAGYAFNPDTVWQKDFEADFPYEETDDQLRCTDEIKEDMEKPRPMERLLCGDVGYGKTEVALRAAFKAVVEGKQVAFLVPTTVLAQQHYNNFVERFKKFPIKVDYLSRFRTAKERTALVRALKEGKVDVVVGTHALISEKIEFKNLGLVVIDEEQRFGVKHKEKLRIRYPAVDTLTLSATPIPRTLHMSLSGIRDISVIEDPPQDRLPVQTYVAEWDPVMIKNAIYKELARHGQVFYLYNRVQSMDAKLKELFELVPEAKIAAAHGQMEERDLEDVMMAFYRGDFDVLLCTSIIESGLDMPNVNTIIVENGERLGLSQLYQIRGRVGRSTRQAYAYITYRKGKELGETAAKRLQAIRENTEFGSGFKIAMRDLEIRGAGSVLGEQQHGQIAAVGYETYCRLLAEVLEEERGGTVKARSEVKCSVEMNAGGFIDAEYIPDEAARFEIYQKIARVETEEEAMELTDELIDRFGTVPDNVLNLMTVSRIRHYAEHIGFTSIIERDDKVMLYAVDKESANPRLVRPGLTEKDPDYRRFFERYGQRLRVSRTKNGAIVTFLPFFAQKRRPLLSDVLDLMEQWVKIAS